MALLALVPAQEAKPLHGLASTPSGVEHRGASATVLPVCCDIQTRESFDRGRMLADASELSHREWLLP